MITSAMLAYLARLTWATWTWTLLAFGVVELHWTGHVSNILPRIIKLLVSQTKISTRPEMKVGAETVAAAGDTTDNGYSSGFKLMLW